jgi:hypothetical protein
MTPLFPKDDPERLVKLANNLFEAFEALAAKEDFEPEMLLAVISNAAAMFAVNHGIDVKRYIELQGAMIMTLMAERKKDPRK